VDKQKAAARRLRKKKKVHPGFNNPAVRYAIAHKISEDEADKKMGGK